MKIKIGIVILAVVGAGLLIALLATKKEAEEQHVKDAEDGGSQGAEDSVAAE